MPLQKLPIVIPVLNITIPVDLNNQHFHFITEFVI